MLNQLSYRCTGCRGYGQVNHENWLSNKLIRRSNNETVNRLRFFLIIILWEFDPFFFWIPGTHWASQGQWHKRGLNGHDSQAKPKKIHQKKSNFRVERDLNSEFADFMSIHKLIGRTAVCLRFFLSSMSNSGKKGLLHSYSLVVEHPDK